MANTIIKGMISVGTEHPLYNKVVDLEVIRDNTGFDGRQTYVRTINPVLFTDRYSLIYRDGRFAGTKSLPDIEEHVEGWLIK